MPSCPDIRVISSGNNFWNAIDHVIKSTEQKGTKMTLPIQQAHKKCISIKKSLVMFKNYNSHHSFTLTMSPKASFRVLSYELKTSSGNFPLPS